MTVTVEIGFHIKVMVFVELLVDVNQTVIVFQIAEDLVVTIFGVILV